MDARRNHVKWYVRVFEGVEESVEFLNRHALEADDVKICSYHISMGLNTIVIYYRNDHELE